MANVPHDHVDEHERRLEDVEEPLVPDHRRNGRGVHVPPVYPRETKVLDDAVDCAHEEERHRSIEREKGPANPPGVSEAGGGAAPVEDGRDADEEEDDGDLDDEAGLHEGMARCAAGAGEGEVCGVRCAPAVEALDDEGEEGKGGEDAAGVEGGVVGDVVEEAAEDVVVGELEEGAWGREVSLICGSVGEGTYGLA